MSGCVVTIVALAVILGPLEEVRAQARQARARAR